MRRRIVDMELCVCRSGRSGAARAEAFLLARQFSPERLGNEGRGGNRTPLGEEESVGCDRERRVVVESSPASAFVVVEADLLLQVLEVALDAPSELGSVDERGDRRVAGQR